MAYIEFPKALYLHGVYRAVSNASEEADCRAQGWRDYLDDKAEKDENVNTVVEPVAPQVEDLAPPAQHPAKRRGRPPKG